MENGSIFMHTTYILFWIWICKIMAQKQCSNQGFPNLETNPCVRSSTFKTEHFWEMSDLRSSILHTPLTQQRNSECSWCAFILQINSQSNLFPFCFYEKPGLNFSIKPMVYPVGSGEPYAISYGALCWCGPHPKWLVRLVVFFFSFSLFLAATSSL